MAAAAGLSQTNSNGWQFTALEATAVMKPVSRTVIEREWGRGWMYERGKGRREREREGEAGRCAAPWVEEGARGIHKKKGPAMIRGVDRSKKSGMGMRGV